MALDLELWAQINLVGHVGWSDYLSMTPDEALACLRALERVVDQGQRKHQKQAEFDKLVDSYKNKGR